MITYGNNDRDISIQYDLLLFFAILSFDQLVKYKKKLSFSSHNVLKRNP